MTVQVAQAAAIISSAFLSGFITTISYLFVPRLISTQTPVPLPLLLNQWSEMYNKGKFTAPPIALVSSLSFMYAAYHAANGQARGLVIAGMTTIAIVPYTLLVMLGTNGKLMKLEKEFSASEKRETETEMERANVRSLVSHWGVLNFWRGVLPLVGAVVGILA